MAKKWDDQASANRLLQQITTLMAAITKWKQTMGESNDVLDDMVKVYYQHATAIEMMNKQNNQFFNQLQAKNKSFYGQQNKLAAALMQKAKVRSDEQDKQTRMVKERHAAYFAMQKEMVDYRHSFREFDAGLNLLSNAIKSTPFGFAAGGAVGGVKGGHDILKATEKEKTQRATYESAKQEYLDFQFKHKKAMVGTSDTAKKLQGEAIGILQRRNKAQQAHKDAQGSFMYQMGQGGAGRGKNVAERLQGLSEWLGRNKKGVLLALGSMVVLGAIIAKALDSSPMFGQMLKLWKFAIMMIFRPLGDFFGFFFRPILVLLLRKFIIPWYTTMYPVMIKLGNDWGTMAAGFIDWITNVGAKIIGFFTGLGTGTFDVNGLVAMLLGGTKTIGTSFIDILVGKLIPSAFASTGNTILSDSWDLFYKGISGVLNTMRPYIKDAIEFVGDVSRWLVSEGAKVVKWGWETIKEQMPFIMKVFQWLKDQIPNVKIIFETFMTSLTWLKNKWTQISTALTSAEAYLTAAVDQIKDLPRRIWAELLDVPNKIKDLFTNLINLILGSLEKLPFPLGAAVTAARGVLGFADGGRITEPILGIGRSGQAYSFGEKGSETVIPDGRGGFGGITINIQNMSGSQSDLNNLRQTILSVVQEANTRRGRI